MTNKERPKILSFRRGEIVVKPISKDVWIDEISLLMPAGRYFVGDPCYTAGQDNAAWQEWCKVTDVSGNEEVMAGTFNDLPVIGLHTAYGDGVYYDQDGNQYGVDAGLIGVVPENLIDLMCVTAEDLRNAGHWATFEKNFIMRRNEDGRLEIGHIVIKTGDDVDESPYEGMFEDMQRRHNEED